MSIEKPKQKYSSRYVYVKNNFVNPLLLTSALMAGSLISHYQHGLAFKDIPKYMLILVIFLIVVIFVVRRSMKKKIAELKNESLTITYQAMKPILITLLLIALILLVTTVFLSVKQPAIYIEKNTYVNNDIGVKFSLPDAWYPYIDDNVKTTHLLAVHKNPYKSFKPVNGMISDNIYPYILFAYLSLDKNEKDLSEKVKEMVRKEFISINTEYKIISDQKTKIALKDAYEIIVEQSNKNKDLIRTKVSCVEIDNGFACFWFADKAENFASNSKFYELIKESFEVLVLGSPDQVGG